MVTGRGGGIHSTRYLYIIVIVTLVIIYLYKYVFQNIANLSKCLPKPTSYFQRASLMFSSVNQVFTYKQ